MPAHDEGRERLPEIQVNARQLRDITVDAWDALLAMNEPPVLFRRGRCLVRRVQTDSGVYLFPVSRVALFGLLIRAADWVRVSAKGPVAGRPPPAVVSDMLRFHDPRLPSADGVDVARL